MPHLFTLSSGPDLTGFENLSGLFKIFSVTNTLVTGTTSLPDYFIIDICPCYLYSVFNNKPQTINFKINLNSLRPLRLALRPLREIQARQLLFIQLFSFQFKS